MTDLDTIFNMDDYTGLGFPENLLDNTNYIVFSLIHSAFILPYFSNPPPPQTQRNVLHIIIQRCLNSHIKKRVKYFQNV
jgi:hypothetical protein